MSWIGGSLSSITGQLSNLTKDILTEGTEEVSDHATELKIAQDKISESETIITSQKIETDRLKRIIHELEEKAESAELQINSISREYRTLLLEKEKEINTLKQTQNEALQHHHLSSEYGHPMHTSPSSNSGYHGGFASDDLDFGDNITMQHEINRLTQEVQRLRSEVKRWKSTASQTYSEASEADKRLVERDYGIPETTKLQKKQGEQDKQDLNGSQQVIELKNQLKELEKQLHRDKEQHQQEVVSLQDVHQHKLSSLRHKHKSEVEQHQQTIQELQRQLNEESSSTADKTLENQNKELESTLSCVEKELELLQSEKKEYLDQISDLRQQVIQCQNDLQACQSDLQACQNDLQACQSDLQAERDSAVILKQQIQDGNEKIQVLQQEYEKVCSGLHNTKYQLLDQLDANHAQALELLGDLQEVRRHISCEARTVRHKSNQEKQDLVNLMIETGNKQRHLRDKVEVLQGEHEQVTSETEKMVADLGHPEHQQLTAGIMDTIEKENLILRKKVVEQKEQITLLEKALQTVTEERQNGDSNTESQQPSEQVSVTSDLSEMSLQNQKLDNQVVLLRQQIHQYEQDIEQFEVIKSDWQTEKEALEDVLMDLREQLRQKETALNIVEAQKGLAEVERQERNNEKEVSGDSPSTDDESVDRQSDTSARGQLSPNSGSECSTGDTGMDIQAFTDKLELLTQANAQLEYERDQLLQNKDQGNQSELESLQKLLQEKNNVIAELTLDKEKLELHLDEQSNELHRQLRNKDTAMNNLQNDQDKFKGQMSELSSKLENSLLDNGELQQQLEEKLKEIESLKFNADVEQQVVSLKNELEEQNSKLHKDLEVSQMERQELETSLIELDTQHQEAMDQLIKIRNGLNQQLELIRGQLNDAESVINQMKKEAVQLHQEIEEKQKTIATLEQELNQAREQSSPGGVIPDQVEDKDQQVVSQQEEMARCEVSLSQDSSQDGKEELIQLVMETRSQLQEKEEAVCSLEEQVEDLETQAQEKDRQIHSLQQQLDSLREWNDQTDEEVEISDLKDKNSALEQSLSELQSLCDKKDSELKDCKQKLQSGAIAINDLHMDIKDLEDSLKRGEKAVAEKVDKIKELRTLNEQLKTKVNELESRSESLGKSNEELHHKLANQCSVNKESEMHQTHLSTVESDLEKYRNKLIESDRENKDLVQQVNSLTVSLSDVEQSKSQLLINLNESEKTLNEIKETSEKHIKQLGTEIDILQSENISINEKFTQKEKVLQTQIKYLESYVNELQEKQEHDASSLEQKHLGLRQELCDKNTQIARLENNIQVLTSDKKTLQAACDGKNLSVNQLQDKLRNLEEEAENLRQFVEKASAKQTELSNALCEREQELSQTQNNNTELHSQLQLYKQQLEDHQVTLDSLKKLQQQVNMLEEENENLKQKLLTATEEVKQAVSTGLGAMPAQERITQTGTEASELSGKEVTDKLQCLDPTADLQKEIAQYKSMVAAYDEDIDKLNQRIEDQARTLQDQDKDMIEQDEQLTKLQQSSSKMEEEIIDLKKQLQEKSISTGMKERVKKGSEEDGVFEEFIEKSVDGVTTMMQNGRLDSIDSNKESNVIEEMEHLQTLIQEKDKVIKELQGNNSSLLRMLEGKGGNSSLLEVHRLENEVRSLKLEREQMMAVMNEKSRECSGLKSEVHRLMNIISAEKVALQKLQTDNQELMQRRESPERDDDMQKEALQTLSRLVRDKDLEVEALTQKNQTLLQVLQESSSDGASVSGLVQEKDNLTKQLATLQSEKEQMMNFLNQKHQESVAYHGEIQRLTAYINAEVEKHTKIVHDYESLKPQFEDNKQALLKAQNDMINYKQKYTELEVKYGELLQRSNAAETVDLPSYNCKLEEVRSLQEKNKELLDSVREKDIKVQSLRQQSVEQEESLVGKEGEITSLKKQVDSLTFQIQGLQAELSDLTSEKSSSQQQIGEQGAQVQLLKEANDQLTLTLQEKEFELKSLQEKTQTLTAILQDQQQGEAGHKGQVDKLMQENESILSQARQLQQERDLAMMTVKQRQNETQDLIKEVQTLKDREVKAHRELERLRTHLIQIEDGYTKEALEAEEREKDLRNRLVMAEENLITSTSAVQTASQNASLQVDSLQQQLSSMAAQRDQAYLQISGLQEQCQQYSVSLANLQIVLEQFQQEKDSLVAVETEKYQRENATLRKNVNELKNQYQVTKSKLEEAEDGLEAASRLSEQLDKKEEALAALKEEVLLRENALKAAEEEIHKLTSVHDSKVDKLVIKNLFLGYFTTGKGQQQEVLRAIGGVLHFTPEDFDKINNPSGRSWMPGFLRFGSVSTPHHSPVNTPTRTPKTSIQATPQLDKSFSELFVKFLEKESSPPPPAVRLPAEEMVADIQRQKEKPAYNPFTAPRHVAMPLQVGESSNKGHDSHIFMSSAPMSPTIPMFSPLTADHTGHSQPSTSSSAILKDVLSSR